MPSGKALVVTTGIICISAMEIVALLRNVNGQLFATAVGAVCVIVGYMFGKKTDNKDGNEEAKGCPECEAEAEDLEDR